jgi:hypothetical protein
MVQEINSGWDTSGHQGCEEREACDASCCGSFSYRDGTTMRCCDVGMDANGNYWSIGAGMAFRDGTVAELGNPSLILTRVEGIHSQH